MSGKIVSIDELRRERARLRDEGKQLVFTNGCFDILHVGHVRYLRRAHELGDALLVAINSDRSVRELKGAGRPVMNEDERAELVAALGAVDYVTIFDDISPRSLIKEVLPDILVKGGDYSSETLNEEERAALKKIGAEIRLIPFEAGYSTSRLIEEICKNRS